MKKSFCALKTRFKNLCMWSFTAFKHSDIKPPVYAYPGRPGLKLHVGCGEINLQGWVNLDARKAAHVHITTDSLTLDSFASSSISEIYICHVLEHLSLAELQTVLQVFHDKLLPGGCIRISVPSFDSLVEIYLQTKNIDDIHAALMGGQDYPYNFHKTVFNESLLVRLLQDSGFTNVKHWAPREIFGGELADWSCSSISLNLQANT